MQLCGTDRRVTALAIWPLGTRDACCIIGVLIRPRGPSTSEFAVRSDDEDVRLIAFVSSVSPSLARGSVCEVAQAVCSLYVIPFNNYNLNYIIIRPYTYGALDYVDVISR